MSFAISSMTGFARLDGVHEDRRWVWELKSVNSRGLELRFRLPPGFDELEPELRNILRAQLSRGAVSISLNVLSDAPQTAYAVNQDALDTAIAMTQEVSKKTPCDPPRPEGILALRGVLEPVEAKDDEKRKKLLGALTESFAEAVRRLKSARDSEGKSMAEVLSTHLDSVAQLTADAGVHAAATPEALRDRLKTQIKELLEGSPLPEDRLAQEAAMLAVKADIREELDRLKAHIDAGRLLLNDAKPVGRRFDFLTQEFNREANTLCSKVQDMSLKRIGLDLKNVIDQMPRAGAEY